VRPCPWDIDKSVFAPRKRESDGRDYYNHGTVKNKQFEKVGQYPRAVPDHPTRFRSSFL